MRGPSDPDASDFLRALKGREDVSIVVVILTIPAWLNERWGNPDSAALEWRVLETLVADCLRTGVATVAMVPGWLGLDEPSALDAFLKARRIVTAGVAVRDGA